MIRVAAALLISALVLWGGFTLFALWGDNYRLVVPDQVVEPGQADWQMLSGTGHARVDGWALLQPGRRGRFRVGVGLSSPISAENVERVEVEFSGKAPHRPVRIGWSQRATGSPGQLISAERASAGAVSVGTDWLRPDSGNISLLVIEVFGVTEEPLVIEAVRFVAAKPGFEQFQRRLFGEWIAFPPWTQRSANSARPALKSVMVSPVLAVASWVVLAILLAWAFGRFSTRFACLAAVVMIAFGWLLLDVRWQADLFGKAASTLDSYSGKSRHERRAADLDGRLFKFIEALKDVVDDDRRRVFAFGHDDYWRTRARYHGLPWSTRTTDAPLSHNWTRHLRSGDIAILLDAPHIEVARRGFAAGPDEDFSKVFELSEVAGHGAALDRNQDQSVLVLEPGEKELVRGQGLGLPVAGLYRVTARLEGETRGASARVIVRWRNDEGERVTALDRQFDVASGKAEAYSFVFVLPIHHDVRLFVVDESNQRLRAEAVRIDRMPADDLVWLKSDERGPFLVVKPLLVEGLNRAYEVQ